MSNTNYLKLSNRNNNVVQQQSILSWGKINTIYAYVELGLRVKISVTITVFKLIPLYYEWQNIKIDRSTRLPNIASYYSLKPRLSGTNYFRCFHFVNRCNQIVHTDRPQPINTGCIDWIGV